MLIGVMSDSHDNIPAIRDAAALFVERGVEAILHAGDFVSPFALKPLAATGIRFVGVFGNNDGERVGLRKVCPDIHEPPHRFHLSGRALLMVHDPEIISADLRAGAEVVVHGHTHQDGITRGDELVINPGETAGWLTGRRTVALLDLDALQAEIVEIGKEEDALA